MGQHKSVGIGGTCKGNRGTEQGRAPPSEPGGTTPMIGVPVGVASVTDFSLGPQLLPCDRGKCSDDLHGIFLL